MSKNISELPYTEICERVQSISRTPDETRSKIRGTVQDVYSRSLPYKYDWDFLMAGTSIVTREKYTTGTVSINTGDTALTFSSDVVLTNSMNGQKIKISGNDAVYTFAYSTATSGTVTPAYQGPSNASSNSYSIFQPVYTLPSNFDRFPKNGGVYRWTGGQKEILSEEAYQQYAPNYQAAPTTVENVRLVSTDSLGRQQIEFRPSPDKARVYGVDYLRRLEPMYDDTQGTVTIVATDTTVTGSTACRFMDAQTGDWFRIDNFGTGENSQWYRIVSIANDSSMTIQNAFIHSGASTASYTISRAPDMPIRLHPALMWTSLKQMNLDQSDPNAMFYKQMEEETMSDCKRLYLTRNYSQKMETIAEDYLYRR